MCNRIGSRRVRLCGDRVTSFPPTSQNRNYPPRSILFIQGGTPAVPHLGVWQRSGTVHWLWFLPEVWIDCPISTTWRGQPNRSRLHVQLPNQRQSRQSGGSGIPSSRTVSPHPIRQKQQVLVLPTSPKSADAMKRTIVIRILPESYYLVAEILLSNHLLEKSLKLKPDFTV